MRRGHLCFDTPGGYPFHVTGYTSSKEDALRRLSHCVAEAAAEGGSVAEERIREANAAIARLVGS